MSTSEKAILAVIVIFAIAVWLLPLIAGIYFEKQEQKKHGEPDGSTAQYDERQKLIRLKAYTHAYHVLMGYLLVWLVLEFIGALRWEDHTFHLLSGGLMLAFTVSSGECILRGAMLGYNQRKNEPGQILTYFSLGACWAVMGGTKLETTFTSLETMSPSLGIMQLLLGTSYLIMGALMLYARHRRKLAESRMDTGDGEA